MYIHTSRDTKREKGNALNKLRFYLLLSFSFAEDGWVGSCSFSLNFHFSFFSRRRRWRKFSNFTEFEKAEKEYFQFFFLSVWAECTGKKSRVVYRCIIPTYRVFKTIEDYKWVVFTSVFIATVLFPSSRPTLWNMCTRALNIFIVGLLAKHSITRFRSAQYAKRGNNEENFTN